VHRDHYTQASVIGREVAGELPWTPHECPRDELGPFDGVLAAFVTLAHPELLALQDLIGRVDGDTVSFEALG